MIARHPRPHLANVYVAPRNETEQLVANIWEDILGLQQVGVYDNFLDLGGDSLQATQLVSRLRESFHADLSLRAFFETPTVAGVAQAITSLQAEQDDHEALEILAMLEQLSEEEIAAEIQKRRDLQDTAVSA
jgi:acyl carrier protein